MTIKKTSLGNSASTQSDSLVLDLDDLDDLFDGAEDEQNKKSGFEQFKHSFSKSFLDNINTKRFITRFIKSSTPTGFNRLFGAYDDLTASVANIKDSIERTNSSDLSFLARKAQSLLPELKDRIPTSLYKNINDRLENKLEQYEYTEQAGVDRTAIRQKRQQENDESVIKAALDQNTLVSKVNFQRAEQGAVRREAVNKAERSIRDRIQTDRFNYMSRGMGMAVDSLTRLAAYNEQVNYGIQKKGLELQFRTYMGIRDLIKVQAESFNLNEKAFTALVRNTALPDHHKTAGLTNGNRKQGGILKGARNTIQNFMGGYQGNVEERVTGSLSSKLGNLVQMASMGDSLPLDLLWKNRYAMLGDFAGEGVANLATNTLPSFLGRKVRPTVNRLAERYGGHQYQVDYALDNIPSYLREFSTNGQNQHGIKGMLNDFISPFLPQYGQDPRLKQGGYQDLNKHVPFNQLAQRSLTEIIPGLLARQLQELRIIRTGDESTPREVFDVTTGKFIDDRTAKQNIQNKIVSSRNTAITSMNIDETLDKIDPEGKLSPKARQAIGEKLLREAATNRRFDPETYRRKQSYASDLDPETFDEIQRLFEDQFSYDDKGKLKASTDNFKLRNEISKTFLDIRNVIADPTDEINRLLAAGNSEPLRALGIIVTERGEDRINYSRIYEIMREDVSDYNTELNPRTRPHSPDPNDKRFMGPRVPTMKERIQSKAANSVKSTLDSLVPKVDLKGYSVNLSTAYNVTETKYKDIFNKLDLSTPLIKGLDLKQGNLIDVTTGKIITKLADITGRVVDRDGLTVVTKNELEVPLVDETGTTVTLPSVISKTKDTITNLVSDKAKETLTPNAEGTVSDPTATPSDWLIPGQQEPVITKRGLINGEYIDSVTGEIIDKLSAVKGDILDRSGNIVITLKELGQGLISVTTGKRWRLTKGAGLALKGFGLASKFMTTNTTQLGFNALKFLGKAAIGIASSVTDVLVDNRDAYLPGEDKPIFYRSKVLNGEYYNKKGEVIEEFIHSYGEIYDAEGNIILEAGKFKDLVNIDGSKHVLAKNSSKWGKSMTRLRRTVFGGYKNLSKRYMKWALKKTAGFYGWAGKKLLGGFAKAGGLVVEKIPKDQLNTPSEFLLAGILEAIQGLKPEELRKGSWEEQAKRKEEAAAKDSTKDDKDDDDKPKSWLGKLAGMIGGLFGKKKKGSEEDDDDNDSDYDASDALRDAAAADDINENRKRRKERKNRNKSKRSPKGGKVGRLSRAGNWIKNSKLGTKVGSLSKRIAGSKVGGVAARVAANPMVRTGLGVLARTAGVATGAAVGILSAPVWATVATVASVAAVGYTGYKMVKKRNLIKGSFNNLRFTQYGLMSTNDRVKAVALEHLLDPQTTRTEDPKVALQAVGGKDILKAVDIDVNDSEALVRFAEWLDARFRPVYLMWIKAVVNAGAKTVQLNKIDEELTPEVKQLVLDGVSHSPEGDIPYEYNKNPFTGEPEEKVSAEDINATIDRLIIELNKSIKGMMKAGGRVKVKDLVIVSAGVPSMTQPNTKVTTNTTPKSTVTNDVLDVAKTVAISGAVVKVTNDNMVTLPKGKLDALTSIRMRAYGLGSLDRVAVTKLLEFETAMKGLFSVEGEVLTCRTDLVKMHELGTKHLGLDLSRRDHRSDIRRNYNSWLVNRFLPVLQQYLITAKRRNMDIREALVRKETFTTIANEGTILTAEAIMGASNGSKSIWESDSIFPIEGSLGDLRLYAEADLSVLKSTGGKDRLSTPAGSSDDISLEKGKQTTEEVGWVGRTVDAVSSALGSVKDWAGKQIDNIKSGANYIKDSIGGFLNRTSADLVMSGQAPSATGLTYGSITAGNGGKWESIPMPSANRSKQAAQPTFKAVSTLTGIPTELLNIFASLESGFDYTVKAKTSSATGWFQFLNATWDGVLKLHGKQYGLPTNDPERKMRLDPRINALMGACFIKDNYIGLQKAIGREPTDTDLYLAHFMGLGGARTFLRSDQNAFGYKVFPAPAKANLTIFYVGGNLSRPRTLAAIYDLLDLKVSKHRSKDAGAPVDITEPPKTATVDELKSEIAAGAVDEGSVDPSDTDTGIVKPPEQDKPVSIKDAANSVPVVNPTKPVGTNNKNAAAVGSESVDTTVNTGSKENTARSKAIAEDQQFSKEIYVIQQQQLAVMLEMRDHLKQMVSLATGGEQQPTTPVTNRASKAPNPTLSLR